MSYLETFLNNQAYSTHENWQQFRAWLIQEVQDHYDDFRCCNIMAFLPKDPAEVPRIIGGINFSTRAEYIDQFLHQPGGSWFCAVIDEKDQIKVGFNTATFGEGIFIRKMGAGFTVTVDHFRDRTKTIESNEEVNWPEILKAIAEALLKEVKKAS